MSVGPTELIRRKRFSYLYTEEENKESSSDMLKDLVDNKNLLFQAMLIGAVLRLAKMPGGMKVLETWGREVIKGLFDSLDSLGQASSANAVAAWANPILISGVLERFGILPPDFNDGYHKGITVISGVDIGVGVLKDIFGSGGAFPTSLVFAKKGVVEG